MKSRQREVIDYQKYLKKYTMTKIKGTVHEIKF